MAASPGSHRARPGGFQRLIFKLPALLYRGWLGERLQARQILLLTTVGRRSGQLRTTAVNFSRQGNRYIVFVGWGERTDWYRNLLADPNVGIQVGRRRLRATAQPVEDLERRRELIRSLPEQLRHGGPPRLIRVLLRRTCQFDFDAELARVSEQADSLPVVEITPRSQAGAE